MPNAAPQGPLGMAVVIAIVVEGAADSQSPPKGSPETSPIGVELAFRHVDVPGATDVHEASGVALQTISSSASSLDLAREGLYYAPDSASAIRSSTSSINRSCGDDDSSRRSS